MRLKRCSRCSERRPIGENGLFNRDRSRRDGYYPLCRPCAARDKRRRYALEHPQAPAPGSRAESGELDLRVAGSAPCACGCGGVVTFESRRKQGPVHHVRQRFYLHGHNGRGKERPELRRPVSCGCGCGGIVAPTARIAHGRRFLKGHVRISASHKAMVAAAQRARPRRAWTTEERLSRALVMRSIAKYGPENPSWRGGGDPSKAARRRPEYRDWREAAYKRDDWTCQKCRRKGGRLHLHHVDPVSICPESIYDVNNGLTLCIDCHTELHRYLRPWSRKSRVVAPLKVPVT